MQTSNVNVIICVSCKKYCKKQTNYMEVFYHCILDDKKVIRSCIEKVKGSTPRINEAMLHGKCPTFERKRGQR